VMFRLDTRGNINSSRQRNFGHARLQTLDDFFPSDVAF